MLSIPDRRVEAEQILSDPGASLRKYDTVHTLYYDVFGSDLTSLKRQMGEIGPINRTKKRQFAYTQWVMHWSWPRGADSRPLLKDAQVDTEIHVVLPRWIPERENAPVRKDWSRFIIGVVEHERGHVLQALRLVDDLKSALRKGSEEEWSEEKAQSVAKRYMKRLHQLDLEYDRESVLTFLTHGRIDVPS